MIGNKNNPHFTNHFIATNAKFLGDKAGSKTGIRLLEIPKKKNIQFTKFKSELSHIEFF